MKMKSVLFRLIPESLLKNKIRCFFYNRSQNIFRVSYHDNLFHMDFGNFQLKFVDNLFYSLVTDQDYLLGQKIQPGDTVIDAGAFMGSFTLLAAKLTGDKGHVFSFEPDPGIAAKLRRQVEVNNLTNVTIIEKGLWSSETVLRFQHGKELGSKFIPDATDTGGLIEVPVTTLDAVLRSTGIANNLFVKMNIEGSEIEALKGAAECVSKYRPYFTIRTDHYVDGALTFKPVEASLKAYGYTPETRELNELTTFSEPLPVNKK